MQIIKDFDSIGTKFKDIVLTIGNFDGLHLGHQKILHKVIERARSKNGTSAVLTFEPHPAKVLHPYKELRIITPFKEKARLIDALGIDLLLCLTFDKKLADMEAEDFIRDVIVERIGATEVIVGHNYRFGRKKKGTIELLQRRGKRYGFRTVVIRNKILSGTIVSSSRIRDLISHGKVHEALHLLGRPYIIEGRVIKGKGRGARLLNIPTANLETAYELLPAKGVYVVKVSVDDSVYGGVMNIGENPTFCNGSLSLEVHILDFSGDLLGSMIKVNFLKRLRGEKRFPDIETLRKAILNDINSARKILDTFA